MPDLAHAVRPAGLWYVSQGGAEPEPNAVIGDDPCWLWLAPDRRLVVAYQPAARPEAGFVTDMTDGLSVFALFAPHADSLLAMGSTLDPALLRPGRCAQTLFAGVRVVLLPRPDALHLFVERPLTQYLRDWFGQAATALA